MAKRGRKPKIRPTSFKLDQKYLDALDRICGRESAKSGWDVSRTAVIRKLIDCEHLVFGSTVDGAFSLESAPDGASQPEPLPVPESASDGGWGTEFDPNE